MYLIINNFVRKDGIEVQMYCLFCLVLLMRVRITNLSIFPGLVTIIGNIGDQSTNHYYIPKQRKCVCY